MSIVFVKTRWDYKSYTDFWQLVKLSSFETCYVDEMDVFNIDNCYILATMNGEWKPFIEYVGRGNHKAQLNLWNLERPGGSNGIYNYIRDNQNLIDQGFLDRVFVSDKALAEYCKFDYMPLGIHSWLGHPGKLEEKEYDLIALSAYSYNRAWMYSEPGILKHRLEGLSMSPNSWGDERHQYLIKSRLLFNVHQDEFPYIEPLRFVLAMAYGLPIISEYCKDAFPYSDYNFIAQSDKKVLLQNAKKALSNYVSLYNRACEVRDIFIKEYDFKDCVERIV